MFIILKHWPSIPEAKQPANHRIFDSMEDAEKVVAELEDENPGRVFTIIQV